MYSRTHPHLRCHLVNRELVYPHYPTVSLSVYLSLRFILASYLQFATASLLPSSESTDIKRPASTGRLQSEPTLPPRSRAGRTSTPPINCYTDYRNDVFSKQDHKTSSSHHTNLMYETKIEMSSTSVGGTNDFQLKNIKNTPPLPRRKKRHRPRHGGLLCCFHSDDTSGSGDYS